MVSVRWLKLFCDISLDDRKRSRTKATLPRKGSLCMFGIIISLWNSHRNGKNWKLVRRTSRDVRKSSQDALKEYLELGTRSRDIKKQLINIEVGFFVYKWYIYVIDNVYTENLKHRTNQSRKSIQGTLYNRKKSSGTALVPIKKYLHL